MITPERKMRHATLVVMAGLIVELGSTLYWTPLTFVLFSLIGVPLIFLGIALYAMTVLQVLKDKKAL